MSCSWYLPARTKVYRPNSRSISQPSRPLAASGRTGARAGAGRPALLAGNEVLAPGDCEDTCVMLEKKPPACESGNGTGATP